MKLYTLSATELLALMNKKQLSAAEVTEAALARIQTTEPLVDAFLYLDTAGAIEAAREADRRRAAGTARPLEGLPLALKDNICTRGAPTTCASRMLAGYVPPYSATVVERLQAAGAVCLGKLNMDEFAMGSSCENSSIKPTRNPWDVTRVPGGSSGGAAAAVAAGMVPAALGSDTGGSVRLPAAFCGVVGLRPTYGAVPRHGLAAFASSLDQIGPVARTVADCALIYGAIRGADPARDATSLAPGWDVAAPEAPVQGLRLGVPREYFGPAVAPQVGAAVQAALDSFTRQGARLVELSLPGTEHALAAYTVISCAEAASNLARYDGMRYGARAVGEGTPEEIAAASRSRGFGPEVKRRIMLGTYVLGSGDRGACYLRAKRMQQRIAAEFEDAFTRCDLIVTPTAPCTAFPLGAYAADPLQMYATDSCTVPASLAGLPAASVPCGLDGNGLPIGLQIIGPRFGEGRILAAARQLEAAGGGFPMAEVPV